MAIKERQPKKTKELSTIKGVPVKVETPKQQLDSLTFLSLAALDIGLKVRSKPTGFKDGAMINRGGVLSVTAQRIGALKEGGKTPILSQEDAMYEINQESRARANRRGKGQMEKKMRRLMRSIMAGKPPSPTSRRNYFSFGKGKSTEDAIQLAKDAKKLLESAGFNVLHKPGTRGIHIVGFAKNAGSTVASLQKYVRKKAMLEVAKLRKAQKSDEQSKREKLLAKRKTVTDKLMEGESKGYVARPDAEFDEMFSPDKLSKLSAEKASERILQIIYDPMITDIRRDTLHYLLGRKDVVETLRTYPPFIMFIDKEYKQYISFLKGEKKGAVAMRTPGRNYLADLRARHREERKRQGKAPVQPWNAVMENTQHLMEGKKAVFIRSSYSSAAQTIATVEQMFPGRSISYERSPESVLSGGGHWTITVAARGKRAPPNIRWFQENFGNQMRQGIASKDRRFMAAVRDALAGRTATVDFTNRTVPRWMSGMRDRKKSTQSTLVFKEEYWAKLQSKGIAVSKIIRGTPVYASERDRKKGREPKYYTFKFTLSGEKFSKQMEIARADVKKKFGPKLKEVTFKPRTAIARGKKPPLEERVAEKISAMRKEQEKRLAAMRAKKKKTTKKA